LADRPDTGEFHQNTNVESRKTGTNPRTLRLFSTFPAFHIPPPAWVLSKFQSPVLEPQINPSGR
jgi:hypothetical protein